MEGGKTRPGKLPWNKKNSAWFAPRCFSTALMQAGYLCPLAGSVFPCPARIKECGEKGFGKTSRATQSLFPPLLSLQIK